MDSKTSALDTGVLTSFTNQGDAYHSCTTETFAFGSPPDNAVWDLPVDQSARDHSLLFDPSPQLDTSDYSKWEDWSDSLHEIDPAFWESFFDLSSFDDVVAPSELDPEIQSLWPDDSAVLCTQFNPDQIYSSTGLALDAECPPSTTTVMASKNGMQDQIPLLFQMNDFLEPSKTSSTSISKANRTKISLRAKRELIKEFWGNAYPSKQVQARIATSANIPEASVKVWFMNARQRLKSCRSRNAMRKSSAEGPLPLCDVSTTNIDRINRDSPDPENATLDMYLAGSRSEEPVSSAALLAAAATSPPFTSIPTSPLRRSHSKAESFTSVESIAPSVSSMESFDSRGSRQGRRCWKSSSSSSALSGFVRPSFQVYPGLDIGSQFNHTIPYPGLQREAPTIRYDFTDAAYLEEQLPLPQETSRCKFFCTWPHCEHISRNQSAWQRHEAAKHYRPYRWECCSLAQPEKVLPECFVCGEKNMPLKHIVHDHFAACKKKSTDMRTFFRKDQLVQHIERHLPCNNTANSKSTIPHSLLDAWRSDNPQKEKGSLLCGFCGKTFATWTERTDHVAKHLQHGICKAAWWPERRPIFNLDAMSRLR